MDDTARAFDELSQVYDTTREPPDPPFVDDVARTLRQWGVHRLLEVGVGTGRFAAPLAANGIEVTGVDASPGMLSRAWAKQLTRLVRGSAYRLPFREGAFDAAAFVHVLHLLDDPRRAIGEACRVGRLGSIAVVDSVPGREGARSGGEDLNPRRLVYEFLRREGFPIPGRAEGPSVRERALLERYPPERLAILSEEDVTEPLSAGLVLLEKRASRWTLKIPPDRLEQAVAYARARIGDRTRTFHRVRALALWERVPPESSGTPAPSPPAAR